MWLLWLLAANLLLPFGKRINTTNLPPNPTSPKHLLPSSGRTKWESLVPPSYQTCSSLLLRRELRTASTHILLLPRVLTQVRFGSPTIREPFIFEASTRTSVCGHPAPGERPCACHSALIHTFNYPLASSTTFLHNARKTPWTATRRSRTDPLYTQQTLQQDSCTSHTANTTVTKVLFTACTHLSAPPSQPASKL